jgi:hypothetical protein
MTLTPTNCGPSSLKGCSSFGRSTRWKERCVSTSSVNPAQGAQRHDPEGLPVLVLVPTLPYLHPATDEEADAATHCQPFRSPIIYESVAVVWAAASFATQTITPLFKTPSGRT